MKAAEVELAVENYFGRRKNIIVPNVSWGFNGLYYEADLVVVSKSGYAKEIEIKVTRSDLIRDKNKKHGHNCDKFKELYFAIPEKLLNDKEHIPDDAGILICSKVTYEGEVFYRACLEREAKKKNATALTLSEKYQLTRLGTMKIWNYKKKLIKQGTK